MRLCVIGVAVLVLVNTSFASLSFDWRGESDSFGYSTTYGKGEGQLSVHQYFDTQNGSISWMNVSHTRSLNEVSLYMSIGAVMNTPPKDTQNLSSYTEVERNGKKYTFFSSTGFYDIGDGKGLVAADMDDVNLNAYGRNGMVFPMSDIVSVDARGWYSEWDGYDDGVAMSYANWNTTWQIEFTTPEAAGEYASMLSMVVPEPAALTLAPFLLTLLHRRRS